MDDFGKGYSSLHNLKTFPIHALKIDSAFIKGLPQDPQDAAIVKTILNLGESLGLEVLAEGVETKEQHDFLIGQGCRQGQGYLYACPAPANKLTDILSRTPFD
jgi:EAL domain-containing protein (putative c-di-GMP-specific phosphodiesterase class I)